MGRITEMKKKLFQDYLEKRFTKEEIAELERQAKLEAEKLRAELCKTTSCQTSSCDASCACEAKQSF